MITRPKTIKSAPIISCKSTIIRPESDLYKAEMTAYQTKRTQWELDRNAAVSKAEGIINTFNNDFGWAFVNKKDSAEYWSFILSAWAIDAAHESYLVRSLSWCSSTGRIG